jgi:Cu+-exporting ATPase
MATDPVCGMKVDEKSAPAKATYSGMTYYFCSNECKDKFNANPEKYAQRAQQPATPRP